MLDLSRQDRLSDLKSLLNLGLFVAPAQAGAPFYDCHPDAALALSLTSNASANTDGNAGTFIATNEVTEDFALLGFADGVGSSGSASADFRLSVFRSGESPARRFGSFNLSQDGSTGQIQGNYHTFSHPLFAKANSAITGKVMASATEAVPATLYLEIARVLRLSPGSRQLLRMFNAATEGIYPASTAAGTALVSSASGWGTPVYTQVSAALTAGRLITGMSIRPDSDNDEVQVALATGGAGSEIPFLWWGAAKDDNRKMVRTIRFPWPVLVPSGLRLSFGIRGADSNSDARAVIHFFDLPLDG